MPDIHESAMITGARILIIDDDEDVRRMLKIMLEREGYTVSQAGDGAEALAVFQREAPNLILLDLLMPEPDGFTICQQLQALPGGAQTPVIVITALSDSPSLKRAFEAGAIDYITKPIDIVVLKIRMQRSLRVHAAEQAVRRAEAKYRGIFENSTQGLYQATPDGHLLSANPAMARLLGYASPEELISRVTDVAAQLYVRPLDRQRFISELETYGSSYAFETEFNRLDGQKIWISINARRVVDEHGQVHYEGAIEDITARKKSEEALRESDRRYRALIEQASDGIFVTDAQGNYLDANPRGCEMLGYTLEELLHFNIADLVSPEERADISSDLNELRSRAVLVREQTLICKDGSLKPVEVSGKMLVDGRYQGIVRDITERKRAEAEEARYVEQIRQLNLELEERVRQRTAELEHANQELIRDIVERQLVETALRDLSARQETLLAAIPEIVMEVNTQLVYTWANQAGLEFFGVDVIGREAAYYFEGEQDTYQMIQTLLDSVEQTLYIESWQRRYDGEKRLLAWRCRSLKDSAGQVIGALSSAQDITEYKREQEALAHLAAIVSSSDDAIIGKTLEGQIISWNAGAERMYGYTSAEMAGRPISILVPPDIENDVPRIIERVKREEHIRHYETVRMTKTGQRLHVSLTVSPIHSQRGELIGISTITRDITARKLAEQALRDSEMRYRQMFERNRAIKLLIDPADGSIIDANPAALEFYGYSREQLLALKIMDINQLPDEQVAQEMARARLERTVYFNFPHRLASGEIRQVEVYSGPVDLLGKQYLYSIIHDITDRKQAETALRASEEKYRQLVGSIEGIVREVDARTGQTIYISPQVERLLGYPIDHWLTQSTFWEEHIHPQDQVWFRQLSANQIAAGRDYVSEYRMLAASGEVIWVHDAVKASTDQDGQPVVLYSVIIDVTHRKFMEENLERTRRQLELILNSAGEGIFGVDWRGRITFANQATIRMLGYAIEDLTGMQEHAFIHQAYADGSPYAAEYCPIYATAQDGQVRQISNEVFWRKDGSSFPVEYVSAPLQEGDVLLGAVVVFQDVTWHQQAQRALEESEQQFRQVIETVPVIGAVLDHSGNTLFSNEYLSTLTGWPREELLGCNFFNFFIPPDYRDAQYQAIVDHLQQANPPSNISAESEITTRQQTRRLIAWKVAFMRDLHDHALRWMVLGEDITEQRKAEMQAIRADRLAALGRLAAALAHEINNPLQAIQSHLELVMDFPLPEEERLEYLKVVRQQISRLNDITRNVLNFAKPSPAPRTLVAISDLIEQTLKLAGKQLEHNHILVTKELNTACYVLVAPEQIVQIFLNLTINASEAIQHDGHLHIAVRCKDDQAIITFANDGPAIAVQDLPHIFEPFYTTKAEGTGLGLSVSHSLIRQHGGQLNAENISPERGVVFTVTLPQISTTEPDYAK